MHSIPHPLYPTIQYFIFPSPTTSSRQLLPGLSLYFSSSTGKSRRERRETERETMEGPGSVEGDRTTSKCAGSDIGYRWSGYRVIPPSIFRVPGRFQCTVVHSHSLSTVMHFFSICTARTIIPIPARGAIFMKDPPSSEMRTRWTGLLME